MPKQINAKKNSLKHIVPSKTYIPGSIAVVSSPSLEEWDWRNPAKGIGGSETSHVEMVSGLRREGFDVRSFAPVPKRSKDPAGVVWESSVGLDISQFEVVINYRDPELFKAEKPAGAKWWFVSQDVGYPWEPEWLAKVDRYLVLCSEHASWMRAKYPEVYKTRRLFISSNGIKSEAIRKAIKGIRRNPLRLMYASSPDRGLMILLEQWFRIRERVPKAELHVFYGFQNMKKIVEMMGPGDWRAEYREKLEVLLAQPGVVWHDRIGQTKLWKEWAKSNIWPYFCDFPETSAITCMEAQACGAIPVTTNFWALKQNVLRGFKFDGLPQKSAVVRQLMVDKVVELLLVNPEAQWSWDDPNWDWIDNGTPSDREEMMALAQERFDWSNVVNQWAGWLKGDLIK